MLCVSCLCKELYKIRDREGQHGLIDLEWSHLGILYTHSSEKVPRVPLAVTTLEGDGLCIDCVIRRTGLSDS